MAFTDPELLRDDTAALDIVQERFSPKHRWMYSPANRCVSKPSPTASVNFSPPV